MEVDEPQVAPEARAPLNVHLLKLVKDAQSIHGLKHSEFSRYRQYCSRRLRRIYKGVKFLHGRGRYQAKKLDAQIVKDERHLHIPLVSAERAWAHAMDTKNEIEQSMEPRKRHHLIRRLSKAVAHATELSTLAAECCDARSSIEAEAYALWMTGNLLLEKETDWENALASFLKASKLLDELSKLGDLEQRSTCRYFLDQVDPAIRFCRYQISRRAGTEVNTDDLLMAVGPLGSGSRGDVIQSKLAALAAETQAHRATGELELDWGGEKLPVRDDRCRLALHAAKELEAQLPKVDSSNLNEDVESIVGAYDRCINAYSSARAAVRTAAQVGRQGDGAEAYQAELTALDRAVHTMELQHTISRNLFLAENAAQRLDKAWKQQLLGTKSKDRPARPEDVSRLYDVLCSNATELNDVAAQVGGARGETLLDECAAKIAHYQAARCLHTAQSHVDAERWPQAAGLLERAIERLDQATARYNECSNPDTTALAAIARLRTYATALAVIPAAELHVEELKEAAPVQAGIQGLGLDGEKALGGKGVVEGDTYLADNIDVWEAFAGDGEGAPRISRVPPPLESLPVRPIVLDTALMCVEPPSLAERVPKQQAAAGAAGAATGMVSRLFGWGS